MSYTGMSHILGGYEKHMAATNAPQHSDTLEQDDFLTLLVAQLTHQDPLNPMEDQDITGQLAEFSSLEQLTNLNSGMDSLIELSGQDSMLGVVSFIGKTVKADGYNISKEGESVSKLYYSLGEAVANATVHIYSPEGDIIRTVSLGSKQPGEFTFEWDGLDEDGSPCADGLYSVGILAEDANGRQVMVETQVSGVVEGVTAENGQRYLRLTDGRYVNLLNVYEVVDTVDPGDETPDDGDGDNGGDDTEEGDGEAEA